MLFENWSRNSMYSLQRKLMLVRLFMASSHNKIRQPRFVRLSILFDEQSNSQTSNQDFQEEFPC